MKTEKKKKGVIGAKIVKPQEKTYKKVLDDPVFVGIDPSFNGMGIVILDKEATILKQILHKAKAGEVEERLQDIENATKFIPNIAGLYKVFMEGPSYSSVGRATLQMGALHFLLRLNFIKSQVDFKIISPNTLKKFVAGVGKGNAKKELMLLKTFKKWGVEFDDNNLCDAYGLARMALEEYKNEFDK